jgi:RND family efflux transporter MFP subunit
MRLHAPVATLAACAVSLTWVGCSGTHAEIKPTARPGVPVRTTPVLARDLDETLVLTGTLRPRQQVQVVAEVSARLLRVLHDEGARVSAGAVLAQLDDIDYRLSKERALAAQAVAEANRQHALVERERADNLLKTGGITDKDHLAAQVGLQVAEAALAQARAEAAIAAQQHARAQVRAPFAGRVAKRLADPGSMLAVGAPLFTLVDDFLFEFRAAVPSADYGKLHLGAPVAVTLDALPGVRVTGKVARIAPLVDDRTRAFEAVVEVPGGRELVGGLFARAAVRTGQVRGALVVPPRALLRDGSDPRQAEVFVASGGHAERRSVGLGVETADAVQVTSGLGTNDLVILDPPATLAAGAPIDVQAERATTGAGQPAPAGSGR